MVLFGSKPYRIHFVGVGGIGMSGIAELLVNLGFRVSGSDLRASEVTRRLESLGARIMLGHDASNIEGVDVVVISSAVKADNPEVRFARAQKIPVIRRAEMLAELMRLKYGIAVAGSHGKTTTTSLVATVLDVAGCDPTMVVGGKLRAFGSNARLGQSEYLVAEADESDGSFLLLSPAIAIVTNIDDEHLDHFGTPAAIKAAFTEFVNRLPFYGLAALCADHPGVRAILPAIERRFVTYGITTDTADYLARDIAFETTGVRFTVVRRGEAIGTVTARLFGEHNVRNILAVIAVADELGIPFDTTVAGLAAFQGVERRFEIKGEAAGVLVVDDYGHHPEEIRATLAGARRAHDRRIVVAFQPHRFTRTRDCFADFITAFDDAHHVFITDIYAAGEAPIEGITTKRLVEAMHTASRTHVTHVPTLADLPTRVAAFAMPGDLVFTLGAGSISQVGPEILQQLTLQQPHAHGVTAPAGRAP